MFGEYVEGQPGERSEICLIYLPPSVQTLTTLDLWRNAIGDDGAQCFADALTVNRVRERRRLMASGRFCLDTQQSSSRMESDH